MLLVSDMTYACKGRTSRCLSSLGQLAAPDFIQGHTSSHCFSFPFLLSEEEAHLGLGKLRPLSHQVLLPVGGSAALPQANPQLGLDAEDGYQDSPILHQLGFSTVHLTLLTLYEALGLLYSYLRLHQLLRAETLPYHFRT